MKTYTYSEARQQLAALLDRARREGRVQIRRRDGQLFVLLPAKPDRSPLDVPGVRARLPRGEILKWLRTARESSGTRLLDRALFNKRIQRTRVGSQPGQGKRVTRGGPRR
ncbi:MAG: type II toxin-antitoxin system Phd/YefM family antitoxin [Acidobacteria bacterium]|nr:type II toxin-antitoxin system Phd/YefM family antitoxin [Acidobacteriota bacterium]